MDRGDRAARRLELIRLWWSNGSGAAKVSSLWPQLPHARRAFADPLASLLQAANSSLQQNGMRSSNCGTSLPEQDARRAGRGNPRRFHRSATWTKAREGLVHEQ
jgi:hypothetical protein